VEPNVPCELDGTHYRVDGGGSSEYRAELDSSLFLIIVSSRSRGGELAPAILQVLGVSIVKRGHLALDITVLLHWEGDIVSFRREEGNRGHPGSKASG